MAALAAMGLAATCEGQDYLAPTRLTLDQAPPFVPDVLELAQPYRGRNTVDYAVRNTGDTASRYGVFAASFCWEIEACDEKVAARVVGPLEAGAEVRGRLGDDELGLGDRLHLEFHCFADEGTEGEPCSGVLDVVLSLSVVDCVASSDCGANEECDRNLGTCRIQGAEESGCQVGDSMPRGWLWPLLAGAALVGSAARRGRSRAR